MKRAGTLLLALAGLAGLWAAGRMHPILLRLRAEYRLNQGAPLDNAPPLVAFTTVALGGFRGTLADALWIRATLLQDQGDYFELMQLADWITKLEPRFTAVWAFQAWNLAYNISVLFYTPEDRWRWVRAGITLLRDEGLFYNPGDAGLYRELSWLFFHKLGEDLDDAHLEYKQAWAAEMAPFTRGPATDFTRLAAPQAERLRREYKMDPARIREVDAQYGPLDWRLPQAHAVYWAAQGRACAGAGEDLFLQRLLMQSMYQAFRQGRLVEAPDDKLFLTLPRPEIATNLVRLFEAESRRHPDDELRRQAVRHLLQQACVAAYLAAQPATAALWQERLRREFPDATPQDEAVDAFIRRSLAETLAAQPEADAIETMHRLARQAYLLHAVGQSKLARGFEMQLQMSWQARRNPRLPSLAAIRAAAFKDVRAQLKSAPSRARLLAVAPPL